MIQKKFWPYFAEMCSKSLGIIYVLFSGSSYRRRGSSSTVNPVFHILMTKSFGCCLAALPWMTELSIPSPPNLYPLPINRSSFSRCRSPVAAPDSLARYFQNFVKNGKKIGQFFKKKFFFNFSTIFFSNFSTIFFFKFFNNFFFKFFNIFFSNFSTIFFQIFQQLFFQIFQQFFFQNFQQFFFSKFSTIFFSKLQKNHLEYVVNIVLGIIFWLLFNNS